MRYRISPKPQHWAGGGGFQDTYGQSVTISPSVMFGLKGVRRLTEIPELCTGQVAAQQAQPAVRSRDESL